MNLVLADPEVGEQVEFVTPEAFSALLKQSLESTNVPDAPAADASRLSVFTDASGLHQITVELPSAKNLRLHVFDLSGRPVMHKHWSMQSQKEQKRLAVDHLPAGLYLIRASGEGVLLHTKFVK